METSIFAKGHECSGLKLRKVFVSSFHARLGYAKIDIDIYHLTQKFLVALWMSGRTITTCSNYLTLETNLVRMKEVLQHPNILPPVQQLSKQSRASAQWKSVQEKEWADMWYFLLHLEGETVHCLKYNIVVRAYRLVKLMIKIQHVTKQSTYP